MYAMRMQGQQWTKRRTKIYRYRRQQNETAVRASISCDRIVHVHIQRICIILRFLKFSSSPFSSIDQFRQSLRASTIPAGSRVPRASNSCRGMCVRCAYERKRYLFFSFIPLNTGCIVCNMRLPFGTIVSKTPQTQLEGKNLWKSDFMIFGIYSSLLQRKTRFVDTEEGAPWVVWY